MMWFGRWGFPAAYFLLREIVVRLEIFTGQSGITKKFLTDRSGEMDYGGNAHLLYFPEELGIYPHVLVDEVRKYVIKAILLEQDFQILTFSPHVFKGTRLAIREMRFKGAKCYQYIRDGREVCADIALDGGMNIWITGIFGQRGNEKLDIE